MTLDSEIKIHLAGYEERKRLALEREKLLDERDAAIHQSILDLTEKMEQTIITVRDSTPASLSKVLQDLQDKSDSNGEKLDALSIQTQPLIDIVDVTGKVRKGTLWLAAFLIAIAGIISSVIHIKNTFR